MLKRVDVIVSHWSAKNTQ